MAHHADYTPDRHAQQAWYCERCARSVKAAQVVRRPWGPSVAIVCPTCSARLGEIRYSEQAPPDAATDMGSPERGGGLDDAWGR